MKTKIQDIIESGPINEILAILDRFQYLPEFGEYPLMKKISEQAQVIIRLEELVFREREKMRENAERLLIQIKKVYSDKEISKATGYAPGNPTLIEE